MAVGTTVGATLATTIGSIVGASVLGVVAVAGIVSAANTTSDDAPRYDGVVSYDAR